MCGFVGCFGIKLNHFREAGEKISHRGPDDSKYCEGENWSLKFYRLSIIDLSKNAMQPFVFKGVEFFVNGEIYNYLELKKKFESEFDCKTKSDIEILPFLYNKYGINFLKYLNGMFSMVIIDKNLNKKFLVKDRFGKKPLYYSQMGQTLLFSSEIKGLKPLLQKIEIDRNNVAINLLTNLILPPLTPYKNIFSVMPGSYVEWSNNSKIEKFWYKPNILEKKTTYQKIKENFDHHSNKSIDLRLRSDVPVGIFLSGGLDSNYILKKALRKNKDVFALICNIPNKDKFSNSTDTEIPKKICNDLKCKHKVINFDYNYLNKNLVKMISNFDEIITNSGALIFYALAEEAKKKNIKVILTGTGGDEIAGGYYWQRKLSYIPNFLFEKFSFNFFYFDKLMKSFFLRENKFLFKIYKLYQLIFKPQIYHLESHGSNMSHNLQDTYKISEKKLIEIYKRYADVSHKSFGQKKSNLINFKNIFMTISTQNYIMDISTMFHSIENRSPLLDVHLFEYMMSVPLELKNKKKLKYLYKKVLSDSLPNYVLEAKKSGPNLPIKIWFQEANIIEKIISYIQNNRSYIKKYVSLDLARKLSSRSLFENDTNFLITFKLLSLIIWLKINSDKTFNYEQTLEELINN